MRKDGSKMREKILRPGMTVIAGAGSEAGLITVRALQAVKEADVIVYDDLMDHAILEEASRDCIRIPAGKRKNAHKKEQDEIQQLLIDLARAGKKVVRLKGGDPTVLGRGGEEALALERAGVPYELIPGVSSCISALEHMGISITQRGLASSFIVVTGHGDEKTAEDYSALAKIKGTIVYLMALSRAEEIAEGLLEAGKDPETPVSVLSCAYMKGEKRIDGCLRELGAIAEKAKAPAILVIGAVAAMHLQSCGQGGQNGAADGPAPASADRFSGTCALVVGSSSFTRRMAQTLERGQIRAVPFACLEIEPRPAEIPADPAQYDWLVFTSANGVQVFLEEMDRRRQDLRGLAGVKIACIGRGTARELESARLYADLIPEKFTSEGLAEALAGAVKPQEKVLILRAAEGNPLLTNRLKNEKIIYYDCRIYSARCAEPEGTKALLSPPGGRAYDYVIFASAGGVRCFLEKHPLPAGAVPVCIGEITASEVMRRTGRTPLMAAECSVEGILQAISSCP